MVFFSSFFKGFKNAVDDVANVVRAPIDFALRPLHNVPVLGPIIDVAEEALLLANPITGPITLLQKIVDDPKGVAQMGDVLGEVIETVGFITGQPEIVGAGAFIKGAADVVGGFANVKDAVSGDKIDLQGVVQGLTQIGDQIKGLSILEEEENTKLGRISNTLQDVGGMIKGLDERLSISNKLLSQEIKTDLTHNEQMKKFITENHGDNEAIKHGQIVLDGDLKALQREEMKEEDVLNQIRTAIDEPGTESDFVKDIENFNEPKAILEYLAENILQIEGLEADKIDVILDLALTKGVLAGI